MGKCSNGDITMAVTGRKQEIRCKLHRVAHKHASWAETGVRGVFVVVILLTPLLIVPSLAQGPQRIDVRLSQIEVNGDMDLAIPLPQSMAHRNPMEIQNLSVKSGDGEELDLETVKEIGVHVQEKHAALHFVLSGRELSGDIWVSLSAKVRFPLVPLKVFVVMRRTSLQEKWIVTTNLTRRVPELPVELSLQESVYPPIIRLCFRFVAVDRSWFTLGRERLIDGNAENTWNRWVLSVRDPHGKTLGTGQCGVLTYHSDRTIDITEHDGDKLGVLRATAVGTIENRQFTFEWEVSKSADGKWEVTKRPNYDEVFQKAVDVPKQ